MEKLLHIGEVSGLTSVTPKAIRYYHQIGVLAEPERSESGYRLYSASHLLRLRQIRQLQQLSLSLRQIKDIPADSSQAISIRSVLESLLDETGARIEALEERRQRITDLLDSRKLDPIEGSDENPPMLEKLSALLGKEMLAGISPQLMEQERRLWSAVEGFDWPEGYEERWVRLAEHMASHPEQYHWMLEMAERMVALADEPENSPEMKRLVEDYARLEKEMPLPEGMGSLMEWVRAPEGKAWSALVESAFSPAQRKLRDYVRNEDECRRDKK